MNSIAPSVTDQMTQIYIFVDDYLKEHPAQAAWRRSNNDTPRFTDAEVITIGLLQQAFGCATLKKTDQLVAANWRGAFPHRCRYSQWIARLHALATLVGQLIQASLGLRDLPGRFYLVGGLPSRVCKPIRHGRVRLRAGAALARGRCLLWQGQHGRVLRLQDARPRASQRLDCVRHFDAPQLRRAGGRSSLGAVGRGRLGAGRPGLSQPQGLAGRDAGGGSRDAPPPSCGRRRQDD